MTEHDTPVGRGPHRLAPSADPRWVDAFVVELRLLEVPGPLIGDHLATVEEHLAETGEDVHEAFGDPRGYARALGPAGPRSPAVDRDTVRGAVLGLLGIVLLPLAAAASLAGRDVEVTPGGLVVALLLALGLLALVHRGTAVLRFLVERRWAPFLVGPVGVVLLVAPLVLLPQRIGGVPTVVVGVVGLVALVAGTAAVRRTPPDLVRGPGEGATDRTEGRLATTLLLPGLALLACLTTWLLHALG